MALGDVKVLSGGYGVKPFKVDTRTNNGHNATLKAGEVVSRRTNTDQFASLALTGEVEIGSSMLIGIVANESTETSTAEGSVDVTMCGAGTIIRAKATTATNIDTQAELDDVLMDHVTFDGPSAYDATTVSYTIDENEGDDPNVHGLFLLDGDIDRGTLDAITHVNATIFGSLVGQTMD